MLEAGVATPAVTELASPIAYGSKKDGCLRFYVSYRLPNDLSVWKSYRVP